MTPSLAVQEQVPLGPLTTLGLGGRARHFATCESIEECRAALTFARTRDLPVHILGGGSNTVFLDEGFPGLVLRVAIPEITITTISSGALVQAGAGEQWEDVVTTAVARGLGGIECLAGIPGTAGASPIQNIGAYGQEVRETIDAVTALDMTTLEERTFSAAECGFGYRTSRFKHEDKGRFLITGVGFRLRPDARPSIRYPELAKAVAADGPIEDLESGQPVLSRVRRTVLRLRRTKGMVIDPQDTESRSAGSFFMNPIVPLETLATAQERWHTSGHSDEIPSFPAAGGIKVPAAWLVEHAGFSRGTRRGNVGISAKHALALVNHGGTTAELLALAHEVQEAVLNTFGIHLFVEPVIVSPEPRP
jgi:UDP-N-acetylmuramate dehydrogenase